MTKKAKLKMKKGDLVKVITGDQKGLIGKILSINLKKLNVILENAKLRTKFLKKDQTTEETSKNMAIAIHISNLMPWEKDLNQVSRIGIMTVSGKKERYYKKSKNLILDQKVTHE